MRVLLYHHEELFHTRYQQCFSKSQAVRMLTAYNRLLLLILQRLELPKWVLVSKDWAAGLFAAYAKHTELAPVFHEVHPAEHDAIFFPITHNLDKDYESRIHLGFFETHYLEVHRLLYGLLANDQCHERILNPAHRS